MSSLTREALRYLGVKKADARTIALVEGSFAELDAIPPRHQLAVLPTAEVTAAFGSDALATHLQGCAESALLAATLGAEVDQMIRRAEAVDTLHAAALHACAAAKIEAYCDDIQASMPEARRPRFSPGYADFPLSAQQTLLRLTDAGRRIGLYLTGSCMLVPSKSITAVMGLGPALPDCLADKCARCEKSDCAFRGENIPCN